MSSKFERKDFSRDVKKKSISESYKDKNMQKSAETVKMLIKMEKQSTPKRYGPIKT